MVENHRVDPRVDPLGGVERGGADRIAAHDAEKDGVPIAIGSDEASHLGCIGGTGVVVALTRCVLNVLIVFV